MYNTKPYTITKTCCYLGYVCQAVCINLLPMLFVMFVENYGISYEQLGRLALISFLTQLAGDFFTMRYIGRIGYRKIVVLAHVLAFVGLLMLSSLTLLKSHVYLALTIVVSIYSLGAGIVEVSLSPIIEYMPEKNKAAQMSVLHSAYSWGQVAVVALTVVLWNVLHLPWYILPLIWALIPLFNIFGFLAAPLPEIPLGEKKEGAENLIKKPRFILIMLLIAFGAAAELTMSQWVSLFAESGLGISKTAGDLLGLCMFGVFMGIGRLGFGFLKLPLRRTMLIFAIVCTACYLVAALSQNSVVALIACAVCGLSVSLMWPGAYSLAARDFPKGGTAMFATLAIAGDCGCSAGPWLTGFVSGSLVPYLGTSFALKMGILSGTIFAVVTVVILLRLKKH